MTNPTHPATLFALKRLSAALVMLMTDEHEAEAEGVREVMEQLVGWCAPDYSLARSSDPT